MKSTVPDLDLYLGSNFWHQYQAKVLSFMVSFTAPLKNTQTLEFKSQLMTAFQLLSITTKSRQHQTNFEKKRNKQIFGSKSTYSIATHRLASESTGYRLNLPVSHTHHRISWTIRQKAHKYIFRHILADFWLFCWKHFWIFNTFLWLNLQCSTLNNFS